MSQLLHDSPFDLLPVSGGELTFVGGRLSGAGALSPMLQGLAGRGGPWWQLLEWTGSMSFTADPPTPPADLEHLVRGRWFGPLGDLEVWRVGDELAWRYLGVPGYAPAGGVAGDFFANGATLSRPRSPRSALLWQPRDDAQVRGARPDAVALLRASPKRLAVTYLPFYDRGVVAAVWFQGVQESAQGRPSANDADRATVTKGDTSADG